MGDGTTAATTMSGVADASTLGETSAPNGSTTEVSTSETSTSGETSTSNGSTTTETLEGSTSTSNGITAGLETGDDTTTSADTLDGTSTGSASCSPGEVSPCYEGPAQTRNVGLCTDGVATCQADGTLGTCEGWVGPTLEDCSMPADEDCDGNSPVCAPTAWPRMIGSSGPEPWGKAMFSASGEVHVVNTSSANDAFFPDPGIESSGGPVHFARYGVNGALVVAQSMQGGRAQDFTVDADGNTYVVGAFSAPIDLGDGPGPNNGLFVMRLGLDGAVQWSRQFDGGVGGGPIPGFFQVAYDPSSDTILASGQYSEAGIDLGLGPLFGDVDENHFLVRFASDSNTLDQSTGFTDIGHFAVGPTGTIAMAGTNGVELSIVVAGQVFDTPDFVTHFVTVVDADFGFVELHMVPGGFFNTAVDVAFAPDGSFWVVSEAVGGVPGLGPASLGAYVARYDADGQYIAHRELLGSVVPTGVAVGPTGQAVMVGTFAAGADLGTGPLAPAEGVFAVRYDDAVDPVWVRLGTTTLGGPPSLDAVGIDGANRVVVSGVNSGDASIDFGVGTPVAGYGTPSDTFVDMLPP